MSESPILCHSDLVKASIAFQLRDLSSPCGQLIESIRQLNLGENFWFPTFNMDFGTTHQFDLLNTPSQVGILGEFVRNSVGAWRTAIPFYSVTGFKTPPSTFELTEECFNLWGPGSVFEETYMKNGRILFLGADFSNFTLIHFIESFSSSPLYRYSKLFTGTVAVNGVSSKVRVKMHVRPPGNLVRYDWKRIFYDLLNQKLVDFHTKNNLIFSLSSKKVTDYLAYKLELDPLYLLETTSRQLVEKKLNSIGRAFEIGDFE